MFGPAAEVYALPMAGSGTDTSDQKELKQKLIELQEEHRDLDQAITTLTAAGSFNQIRLQRLKKRKLAIKDQIVRLKGALVPDIIA